MIQLIEGLDYEGHGDLLAQMFLARRRIFAERLNWDVAINADGYEIDRFDGQDPIYLIVTDDGGQHCGSVRLLPTSGETVLEDQFASIMDDRTLLKAPHIWEFSRFCADVNLEQTVAKLLLGICDTSLRAGVRGVVGAFDQDLLKRCAQNGWPPTMLGSANVNDSSITLGIWTVTPGTADTIREATGLEGAILTPEPRNIRRRASRGRSTARRALLPAARRG